ncbi:ER membrane protein complex subunit 6 [Condylostylus longicornis]|uniref:ER membrane protein complex subunit 6 n=1 Tax=Condylostylus longicornis TaxID=2530218 RepID=UPI00244E22DF|nr:ER membrane protein complex subunit 6 [Condylostylus longicornis]
MTNNLKTKELKSGEIIAYSEYAIRNNASAVDYCKTSLCALSGCCAGILGLTGIIGFLFYILSALGLWGLILLKSGSTWQKYFVSRRNLLTNGFLGGLCTYVLFWTFLYGMVHVY